MVEVDVHTLQLEVGGAIVARTTLDRHFVSKRVSRNLLAIAIEAVLASNGLPVESVSMMPVKVTMDEECVWGMHIPESGTNLVTLSPQIPISMSNS